MKKDIKTDLIIDAERKDMNRGGENITKSENNNSQEDFKENEAESLVISDIELDDLVGEVLSMEMEGLDEEDNQDGSLTPEEIEAAAEKNLKLVHKAASLYAKDTTEHDEFFSVALIGYTKALQKYDKNISRFSTFAMKCMTNEMNQFLRKDKNHQSNVSTEKSIYENGEGGEFTMGDSLNAEDYGQKSCDEIVIINQDVQILLNSIEKLNAKEQFIIKNRFGVGGGGILTQSEVAEHLKTSQANISKMETMILAKLKKHMRGRMNSPEFE